MTDNVISLYQWYDELQRTDTDEAIVQKINARMAAASDKDDARSLAFILAGELTRQERFREAENILVDLSAQDPIEPYPLIRLAEVKLYYEQELDDALQVVDSALERARASEHFVRLALGVKARIAERLGRYDVVADVLRAIMAMSAPGSSRVDVGVERDFFDRIPSGAVDVALLHEYEAFCRRKAG